MNREQQYYVWSILPKEAKERLKALYLDLDIGWVAEDMLESVFGDHNLTSDAEPEEMLAVKANTVREMYAANDLLISHFPGSIKESTAAQFNHLLRSLFGSKCLPDVAHEVNFASKEPKPAEPEYHKGDKVFNKLDGKVYEVICKTDLGHYALKDFMSNVHEDFLEPYTEPTDNENLSNPTPLTNKEVTRMKPIASKVSVYLATAEEDEEFRLLLHENGFRWVGKTPLINKSCWSSVLEGGKIHCVYPDKTVTCYGDKTSDTLTFSKFKKQYFEEESRNIANCDKQLDNILKNSFSKERRLNIATQILSGIVASSKPCKHPVKRAVELADALIAECEKGGKS